MKSHRTIIVFFIVVLFIPSASFSSSYMTHLGSKDAHSIAVNLRDITPCYTTSNIHEIAPSIYTVRHDQTPNLEGDQVHPALGVTTTPQIFESFKDVNLDSVVFTNTIDASTDDLYYWLECISSSDYPSIDFWNGTRLFGTITSFNYLEGCTCLIECPDPNNPEDWQFSWWDWSSGSGGWHAMVDDGIACDSSKNEWEWGVCSYVMSNGSDYTNVPVLFFADSENYNTVYLNWLPIEGCQHTQITIDSSTHFVYAVYDWYNIDTQKWELLVWVKDYSNLLYGYNQVFEITGADNLQYPSIAVNDNHIVIVAETEEYGNKDIICLYSNQGMNSLQTSFVTCGSDDERYPQVISLEGESFACTLMKNNNFYVITSTDFGVTWHSLKQINHESIIEEYRASDVCYHLAETPGVWEESHQDIDIEYRADILMNAFIPTAPVINGPHFGKRGVEYTYTFSSIDFDGDELCYYIEWDDGTTVEWEGPYPSGQEANFSHTWTRTGFCTIQAMASDYWFDSDWGTFSTVMPIILKHDPFFYYILEKFPSGFPLLRWLLAR
jgi:hypothetical protein